jgi:hypothetical protein
VKKEATVIYLSCITQHYYLKENERKERKKDNHHLAFHRFHKKIAAIGFLYFSELIEEKRETVEVFIVVQTTNER